MSWWGESQEPFVPKDKSPYEDANWISRMFFFWINPIISLGYFRPLEASDIPPVPKEFSAEVVLSQFEAAWKEEVKQHGKQADAGRAMFKAFKKNIILSSFNFFPYVITLLMQPYLVNDILTFIDGGDDYFFQIKEGIPLAIVFGIVSLINLLCASISFSLVSKSCMAMKVATISAVFAKSLRLSTAAKHSHTTGEKMTLISADAERVWYGVMFINWCWAGPLLMVASMVLLIVYVGWAAVAAFAVMLVLTVVQLIVGKQVGEVRKKQVKFTDERTKVINESLQGIRILKYYAWESATAHRIEHLRSQEVQHLTRFQLLKMLNAYIMFAAPVIVPFTLFVVYIRLGGHLTINKVYTMYALLNVIRLPFSITPMAWASYQEGKVAFSRIGKFLLLDEQEEGGNIDVQAQQEDSSPQEAGGKDADRQPLIRLDKATFTYNTAYAHASPANDEKREGNPQDGEGDALVGSRDADTIAAAKEAEKEAGFLLKDISLTIYPSDFIAIVGSVGSGKTSLLSALLGEMHRLSGSVVTTNPRIAYVAQEHWICNTSVQDNVLFYSPLDEEGYREVIESSQLLPDLLVLPHSDYTSIGERGVNLSGGQKARVSVARALYAGYCLGGKGLRMADNSSPNTAGSGVEAGAWEGIEMGKLGQRPPMAANKKYQSFHTQVKAGGDIDLYIFDDPLASVDVHVGGALFTQALASKMVERKARLLVLSSNYHLLHLFDKVAVMKDGKLDGFAPWRELKDRYPEYDVLGKQVGATEGEDVTGIEVSVPNTDQGESKGPEEQDPTAPATSPTSLPVTLLRTPAPGQKSSNFEANLATINERRAGASHIHNLEEREKGAVALKTYLTYFSFALAFFRHVTSGGNGGGRGRSGGGRTAAGTRDGDKEGVHFHPINYHYTQEHDCIVQKPLHTPPAATAATADGGQSKDDVAAAAAAQPQSATSVYEPKDLIIGIVITAFIFILFSIAQGIRILTDLWLGIYAMHIEEHASTNDAFYLRWFTILSWSTVGIGLLRSVIFVLICLGSSYNLHNILLINVFNASINKYFDVTPMGRILNRFTKDFDSMDALLPDFFHLTMQNAFFVLSILVVCLMSSAYFVLLFFPLGVLFYYLQSYFRKASREMKRLDNISRSPIYSLYGEILSGLVTIKAFRFVPVFTQKFYALIDDNISMFFVFWFSARWLAIRLDLISNFISFFVAILAIILKMTNQGINSNFIGIALVYAVQLTALLQWTVRISIDTETNMTSVERLLYFNQILPEQLITKSYSPANSAQPADRDVERGSGRHSDKHAPNLLRSHPLRELSHWPKVGQITLSNVYMKYRPDLPYVLNGVNMTIPGGCKVGICGRTAAGKSSLMLALFRIVECEGSSSICIDGVNLQSVPLYILRSQLTIIPQEPFMFSGTLRDNLDPFQDYTDEEIFEALDRVQLLDDVKNKFSNGLLYVIAERGENISVGQRQLVCIARALLRKSKVIVMDEATASVDSVTDSRIQQTIRTQFKHCTVLTIAHRLETIADYDLIVVMQQGKVVETGSPLELLKGDVTAADHVGAFRSFVDELGPERKAAFLDIAEKRQNMSV